jgi:hypothetical protein
MLRPRKGSSGSFAYVRPIRQAGNVGEPEQAIFLLDRPQYAAEYAMAQFATKRLKVSMPTTCQEFRSHVADEFDPSVTLIKGSDVARLIIDMIEAGKKAKRFTKKKINLKPDPLSHPPNFISAWATATSPRRLPNSGRPPPVMTKPGT